MNKQQAGVLAEEKGDQLPFFSQLRHSVGLSPSFPGLATVHICPVILADRPFLM